MWASLPPGRKPVFSGCAGSVSQNNEDQLLGEERRKQRVESGEQKQDFLLQVLSISMVFMQGTGGLGGP